MKLGSLTETTQALNQYVTIDSDGQTASSTYLKNMLRRAGALLLRGAARAPVGVTGRGVVPSAVLMPVRAAGTFKHHDAPGNSVEDSFEFDEESEKDESDKEGGKNRPEWSPHSAAKK